MERERRESSAASGLVKGILIGVGIGAAIGSAILGYGVIDKIFFFCLCSMAVPKLRTAHSANL